MSIYAGVNSMGDADLYLRRSASADDGVAFVFVTGAVRGTRTHTHIHRGLISVPGYGHGIFLKAPCYWHVLQ